LVAISTGPRLKSFSFYEDTRVITEAIRKFIEAFINSYYPHGKAVAKDIELHAWESETRTARVVRLPSYSD
jgi:uncharacterized protein YaaR (DUF327 family)